MALTPLPRVDYAAATAGAGLPALHAAVAAGLDAAGAVVIERVLTAAECDAIVREMRPFIDATAPAQGDLVDVEFAGARTRRCGALAARSPASHRALAHPVVMRACDAVLGLQRLRGRAVRYAVDPPGPTGEAPEKRYPWQLHVTQVVDVGPGASAQPIHRDQWAFLHDFQGVEVSVATMWAMTDFTAENGATHVAPGSHRWGGHAQAQRSQTVQAEMPKGSVVVWVGSAFHGAGANRSSEHRIGLTSHYNLSFLRQEENQYLSCPPAVARRLPREIQSLLGYKQDGGALGYVGDTLSPEAVLQEGFDVTVPGMGRKTPARL